MANAHPVHSVTAGPSKFDLMLALFDGTSKEPRNVIFQAEGGPCGPGPYTVNVASVEREDGSGESWNIRGTWWSHERQRAYFLGIHFSTKHRRGSVTFTAA